MLVRNLGLEIGAIHPDSGGTWRRHQHRRPSQMFTLAMVGAGW
jgi:hypothetical protein